MKKESFGNTENFSHKIFYAIQDKFNVLSNILNSLRNNKFLDRPKLKAFTDNKIIIIEICMGQEENIVGKGKMLVTSIFSFFHNVSYPFPNVFYSSENKFQFFSIKFILSSANAFNFDQS